MSGNHANTNKAELKSTQQYPLTLHTLSGLFTGAFCAGIFNPWDRALYLSVKEQRPFLSKNNFARPFQGVFQAVSQRSFAWGSYYIAQEEMKMIVRPYASTALKWNDAQIQMAIGITAGAVSAIVNNPLSVIKYHTWGQTNQNFIAVAKEHLKGKHVTSLTKGLSPTLARDITFGMLYESGRYTIFKYAKQWAGTNDDNHLVSIKFTADMISAGMATIFSSPFNYARNMHYATPLNQKPISTIAVLKNLHAENAHLPLVSKISIFRERFRIGWGTARVAAGMAVGQFVFDSINQRMAKK